MSGTRISGLWGWIILVVIVVLVGSVTASGKVIYVDDDASLGGNGQNWATPYRYLQDALAVAWSGDEIRVAQGIYRPDQDSAHPSGTGNREATFQLKNGVVIKGGYAGLGEPDPDARDIDAYETILSGDIGILGDISDNSYNVVTGSGTDNTAVLDGFIITAGNANGGYKHGGGMRNDSYSSPTVTNCTFSGNSADSSGGGMYNRDNSSPTVTNCTFSGNSADSYGGGMHNRISSNPTVTNCTFSENSAGYHGGGMDNDDSSPMVTNCTFSGNWGGQGGGMSNRDSSTPTVTNCTFNGNSARYGSGMYNAYSSPKVTNCTFSENSASEWGGGMCNMESSSPTVTNCTFSKNSARNYDGGGISNLFDSNPTVTNCTFIGNSAKNYGGGMADIYNSSSTLANCILWANTASNGPQIYNVGTSSATVSYSDVQGAWPGIGNINADPLFVEPAIGDYRLLLGSPCIDAGDNSAVPPLVVTDLNGNPRIIDGTVDMGAYEGPYQGFLLSAESVIVPEGGTATFTVMLAADPFETVEVTTSVESGDPDITVESGGLLTFDSTNYSQPRTVTLTAALDADQLHGTTVILVSATGVYPASITAYELDSEGPSVVYVDWDAFGANDGSSWENAFTDLQEGLSFAAGTFWVREIRVAQGVYSPEGPLLDLRRPGNPNPADGAIQVNIIADLSWTAGPGAASHDVYFGTTSLPLFMQNQTGTTFDPGTMAYSTTYYWRIDEVGPSRIITGAIWSFSTLSAPPPMGSNESLVSTVTVLDREATFQLINGVVIKGGYAGFGAPDPDARDIKLYETILSGDLLGNDGPSFANNGENSYNVVTGSWTNETAVIDGFTITAGNANGSGIPDDSGGGMYNTDGSPTVINCTFSGNSAGWGGGMCNIESSSPTVTNCTFSKNSAYSDGGGMQNHGYCSPTVTNCTFSKNTAAYTGGGMQNYNYSSPTVTNCTFSGNSTSRNGGGMRNYSYCSPTITNCTFNGNTVTQYGGGGGLNSLSCSPTVTNCTFIGNSAAVGGGFHYRNGSVTVTNCMFSGNSAGIRGGGMNNTSSNSVVTNCTFIGNRAEFGGGMSHYYSGTMTVNNCILWENTASNGPQIYIEIEETSSATVSYSDVQGGWPGIGNMNADPRFVQSGSPPPPPPPPPGAPFNAGIIEDDYHLKIDSPCINAGDPDYIAEPGETDLDGKPRVIAGRIDMGAYEFNHDPIADAGPDQTVEAQAPWGATVTLDASGSSDADSIPGTSDDINDFNWYELDPCNPNFDVLLGTGRIIDCNLPIGEHIIILEVIDRAGASDTNEVTIIIQDTTPPDIICPPDVTLECPADTTQSATGKATATDICGAVTITHSDQLQPSCGNAGTLARTWTATDESGNTSTCVQIITVVDTTPPVITCPADVTLQCPADTSVEANGSASAVDTCGSATVVHSDEWQPACGNTGILTRTWSATDECGNSSSCVQTLTVVDTTPPDFELSVSPTMLWPPDHKMVLITPSWTVSDECDATPQVSLVGIVANEGDNTIGDGHTSNDIEIGEDGSIYLRSERSGTSDDRVYTITYKAIDDCGNATVRSATVSIPHDFKVLTRIASRWLWAGQGRIPEDLNDDGVVNLKDIATFANNWIQ